MILLLLFLSLCAAAAALALVLLARRVRAGTGLPYSAQVIYADTGAWERNEKALYSRAYQLAGKPDYIVREEGEHIPVEVKPNRTAPEPRDYDVMQLAAYGLLVEEEFGAAPSHGLLKYRDRVFRIEFTDELREDLLATIEEMRAGLDADDVARSHDEPYRCRACGYRGECDQALEE